MLTCRFCERSRQSANGMIDHLHFWHSISRRDARRLVHHPERPVPDWLVVEMDERVAKLRQVALPD